jgi:hypothetical protein
MYDVLIPSLSEQATVGGIARVFAAHPLIRRVVIGWDSDSEFDIDQPYDLTDHRANISNIMVPRHGKGQVLEWLIGRFYESYTEEIVFSDADYTSFPREAVDLVLDDKYNTLQEMMVVYPRFPTAEEWKADGLKNATFDPGAWMLMSGLRRFPKAMIKGKSLHGYLTEVQLNMYATQEGIAIRHTGCDMLVNPLRFTETRLAAMSEGFQWGIRNGIFGG